jgi:hypothetical protein
MFTNNTNDTWPELCTLHCQRNPNHIYRYICGKKSTQFRAQFMQYTWIYTWILEYSIFALSAIPWSHIQWKEPTTWRRYDGPGYVGLLLQLLSTASVRDMISLEKFVKWNEMKCSGQVLKWNVFYLTFHHFSKESQWMWNENYEIILQRGSWNEVKWSEIHEIHEM